MYRHAFYTRKSSDGWSEEDDKFGRIDFRTREEITAAGVSQRADWKFVERSKGEILNLMKSGNACCGPIAKQLNAKGILNNVGGYWTDRIVKIFADRYLQGRVRY
jgi:hypothetical protein